MNSNSRDSLLRVLDALKESLIDLNRDGCLSDYNVKITAIALTQAIKALQSDETIP